MQAEQTTPLDRLREKQRQLSERIKQLEACAAQKQRKEETRRKVLLGALLAHWMQNDEALSAKVDAALPGFLVRQVDRDVFGLPEIAPKKNTVGPPASSET